MENGGLSENIAGYIGSRFGDAFLQNYLHYIDTKAIIYIRLSTLYQSAEITINNLKNYGITLEKLEGFGNVYKVLTGFENLGKTVDFTLGHYYIQSLSSMIPPVVLNPSGDDVVLDLCAAPGSKTSQLMDMMGNRGTLYANEPNLPRLKGLVFNLDKMNAVNAAVIQQKGEVLSKYFDNYFDKILADVPCSGLGILQKKEEVNNWWNVKQAEGLAELQFKLLVAAIKMLKPGGEIVYSTCTLTLEENEMILDKILKKYPVELQDIKLPVKSTAALTNACGSEFEQQVSKAHRIIPWEIGSEGFFVSKMIKTGETAIPAKAEYKRRHLELIKASDKKIKKHLDRISDYYGIKRTLLDDFQYLIKDNDVYFISGNWKADDLSIFTRVGRRFGLIDKRDECHLHTHAVQILSNHITENILTLENKKELEIYLDGGTIRRTAEPYGQKIVKYENTYTGTAVVSKDGIKSQFPRAMRTSDIVTPN